ncbi:hypothetical protein IEQ34_012507 [Dendrobium chrysotoxum]|uniref:WW domain-containing protein n=1 Tax=Dendrobium chrysotoxum TaxID=161865 RepID=A0AAV7GVM8_DENCH|nr:hypothetical protein IEQ34_012507 [Dendrobium chrysotoxum]
MGKRKERRLAAMSATNRRVKLDLLAEPSEEAVCNSINEEAGVNQEQDHSASVPSSPSSSGGFHQFLFKGLYREDIPAQHIFGGNLEILQKICRMHQDFGQNKENPLLLLGQYSDDELDDEANKLQKDADDADYSTGSEGKEHAVVTEDLGSNKDEVIEDSTCKQELDQAGSPKELKANDAEAIKNACVDIEHCETELISQTSVAEPNENQANGHVNEHWKLVLHEESNQYYYWNTVTGETSWEVPAGLAVDAQNTDEQSVCSAIEEKVANALEAHTSTAENVDLGIYGQVLGADVHETNNIISKDTEGYENIELKTAKVFDSSQSIGQYYTDNVTASYGNLSGYSNLSDHIGLHHALDNEEKDANLSRHCDRYASEDAHASQLVQYGEALLQKSAQRLEGYEGIRKEIAIRLSDCRALSSYGSSLLPFWWHTEVQLKQIESAIDNIEASVPVQTEKFSDLKARQMAPLEGSYSEVTEEHKIIVTSEFVNDMTKNENASTEMASPITDFKSQGSEHQPEIVPEVNLLPDSSNSAPSLVDNTEEDMDVEMEVDEEIPYSPTSITVCPNPSEQFIQTNLPSSQCPSTLPNESNVPPPEEEWIPPPPPEVEPLPPPPPPEGESDPHPEEPSAHFPPSYTETASYPFPDQYNVGYHIPAYGFYTTTGSEVSNGNYYGIVGGSQLIESETPGYYEPLAPSVLPEVASSVTPVGSETYYDVANVSISSGPVLSSIGASAFYVESSAVNYQDMAPVSVHSAIVDLPVDSLDNYLPKVSKESQVRTLQALSGLSTVQALGSSPENDSIVRSKKRAVAVAPTLRSNKKVSSLVDKWMAAKEELHGEEEEPENALEILEKKRQKEIEEWRARQFATGEAQDNANFVPLGGDWRERVKRRRTSKGRAEDAQTSTAVIEKEKKQPDLAELTKDLPSGWQAYWDDSTKQVYYGNHTTSETTWNRPTR